MNAEYVPELTTPGHVIRASTTPKAVVRLIYLLDVVEVDSTPDGGAIWRMTNGVVITLSFSGHDANWNLDVEP